MPDERDCVYPRSEGKPNIVLLFIRVIIVIRLWLTCGLGAVYTTFVQHLEYNCGVIRKDLIL